MLKLEPGQYWIFEADTSIDIWEFQKSHNDTSANKHTNILQLKNPLVSAFWVTDNVMVNF